MLEIKIIVDAVDGEAQGVKEALGMYLERWGKARVVEVRETTAKQMEMKEVVGGGSHPGQ